MTEKPGSLSMKFKLIMNQSNRIIDNIQAGFVALFIFVLSSCQTATNTLSLPSLFSDNMVLQRNADVQLWGKSFAGAEVTIAVPWGEFKSEANNDGSWDIVMPTADYDRPFSMEVCDDTSCINIQNVVLGEVWLASGQSNMSMPLKGWLPTDPIENSSAEIAQSDQYPFRFFKVKQAVSHVPKTTVQGSWKVSNPINAAEFSATSYFFAKNLYDELKVPIGIINSSWGGTPVESWADQSALQNVPAYREIFNNTDATEDKKKKYEEWLQPLDSFPETTEKTTFEEWSKLAFDDLHFSTEEFDDTQWLDLSIPGNYADVFSGYTASDFDGIVWIRKSFTIDQLGKDYKLKLGLVDDMDFTFINGEFIGATVGEDSFKEKQYEIPSGLLREGVNTIAIRLIDTMVDARIYAPISLSSSNGELSLEGNWKAMPTAELYKNNFYVLSPGYITSNPRPDYIKSSAWAPTALFNGMINPLVPYTIQGAIWYQGEANVGFEDEYKIVFRNMIEGWRSKWNNDFPFYFVQIAPYNYGDGLSPALRDAQRHVTSLEKTAMVVTLDIGNPDNIHPAKKNEVGKRLSNLALDQTYGVKNTHLASKPISVVGKKNIVSILFDCKDGGSLQLKNPSSDQIEISEDNINFFQANAVVDDCYLHLYSSKVKRPKYVRHAWTDTGSGAILNSEGIPVSTFLVEVEN